MHIIDNTYHAPERSLFHHNLQKETKTLHPKHLARSSVTDLNMLVAPSSTEPCKSGRLTDNDKTKAEKASGMTTCDTSK